MGRWSGRGIGVVVALGASAAGCESAGPPLPGVPAVELHLKELSGLDLHDGLLAGVSDAKAELAVLDLASGERRLLALPLPEHAQGPQLEGVARDGRGRYWAVEEDPGAVYVFALDGDVVTRLHTFHIVIPGDDPLHAAWRADANARAEGIALMAGGHVLIAKQKDPVRLIELGPEGDGPLGIAAPPLAPADAELPADAESDVVPLAEWAPSPDAAQAIHDISDLCARPEGVWILAGRSHRVAALALPLDPARDTFDIGPPRPIPAPIDDLVFEGLAIDDAGEMYLGVDRQRLQPEVSLLPLAP